MQRSPAGALDRLESARDVCVSKILGGRPHGEKGSESSGLVDNSTPPIWPWVRPLGVVVKCPVRRLLTLGLLVSQAFFPWRLPGGGGNVEEKGPWYC